MHEYYALIRLMCMPMEYVMVDIVYINPHVTLHKVFLNPGFVNTPSSAVILECVSADTVMIIASSTNFYLACIY